MWQVVTPVAAEVVEGGLAGSPVGAAAARSAGAVAKAAAGGPLDPWELMAHSGPVVMAVLVLLFAASVLCWAIVVAKAGMLAGARARSRRFLRLLDADAGEAAARLASGVIPDSPHARIYAAAQAESASPAPPAVQSGAVGPEVEGPARRLERVLARAVDGEVTRMEGWLGILATIGSTAPFVGLFGTVWGIMSSFLAIGAQESATLAVVAPGIAEALIATAVGLFAAIPAVVAYNFFVRRIRVWNELLAAFASRLVNDADRGAAGRR